MDILQWLSLINEYILFASALYQLALITVFVMFAIRIGDIRTLDDLLPEDGERE